MKEHVREMNACSKRVHEEVICKNRAHEPRTHVESSRICAVIVAAGMSSRMKAFKPLLKVGDESFIERMILQFQEAGVRDIVVITGRDAEKLEQQIRHLGVHTIFNEHYETTQMFDSAKMGFEYVKGKCDAVLFTPVDVAFSSRTLESVLSADGTIVIPACGEKKGHPIRIDAKYIPDILAYEGNDGLRGALASLKNARISCVEVDDKTATMDADTREDYQNICNFIMRK